MWWYTHGDMREPYANNFIDHPAITHRIHFWMMEKYGVTGTLYWDVIYTRGKDKRVLNPWKTASSLNPAGGYRGNGDGRLLYPPSKELPVSEPVIEGPVNSIRWEMLREGLEDKEYLWLLKEQIKRLKATAKTKPEIKPAIGEGKAALASVNLLVRSLTNFEMDPLKLYAARKRIAQAIEKLSGL